MPRSDPWLMRVSDADREKYVSVLQNSYAEGRLNHDEYDDRMSSAYQAVTFADLYPLVTDLPVDDADLPLPPGAEHQQVARFPAPDTALSPRSVTVDSSPAVAVFSEVRRGGRWVVPAEQTSVAVMGTLKIDLREALLESGSVRIQAVAVMGEIRIKVPDDVHLEVTGTGVFGEFIRKDKRSGDRRIDAPAGSPHIVITGAAIFGSVTVTVVPAHDDPGSRVLPQVGGQVAQTPGTWPPANVPPAVLPPPGVPPTALPPPDPPTAAQPSAQIPPGDGGDAQERAADEGQAHDSAAPQPRNESATLPPIQPPGLQPPGTSQPSSAPEDSDSPEPTEALGSDKLED